MYCVRSDSSTRSVDNWKMKLYIDALISNEGMSAEKIQNISYIEFVCMIDHIGGNPKYDEHEGKYDYDSLSKQLLYSREQ